MCFLNSTLSVVIFFLGLVGVQVCRPVSARADLMLEIVRDGNSVTSPLVVNPGSTLTLDYFLTQTGSTTSLTTSGVSSAFFTITAPMGIDHLTPISFVPNSGLALDPIYTFLDPGTGSQLNIDLLGAAVDSQELAFVPVLPVAGSNSIFLGRSSFTVSSSFTGPSEILVAGGAGTDASGEFAFGIGDSSVNSPFSNATAASIVVAVPEASSLLMACSAAMVIGLYQRRRTRAARSVAG